MSAERSVAAPVGGLLEEQPDTMAHRSPISRAVLDHLSARLGPPTLCYSFQPEQQPRIDLLFVPPSEASEGAVTVCTLGMSEFVQPVPAGVPQPPRCELMLRLPADWPMDEHKLTERHTAWPLHWLTALARMPQRLATWVGPGHTIPNGDPPQPFAEGTGLCGFLIVLPVCFEEGQDVVSTPAGPVALFSALPIHASELRLALERGAGVLLERLLAANVDDVIELTRAPVDAPAG